MSYEAGIKQEPVRLRNDVALFYLTEFSKAIENSVRDVHGVRVQLICIENSQT